MTKREMIARGRRAVDAAYPEYDRSAAREQRETHPDDRENQVCDTLVDILHFAESKGFDPEKLVDSALGTHYMTERSCGLDEEPDA